MIHTEVVFVDRESPSDIVGRSCSIHYGGKVFLEQKRFSRKQWRFRSVSCSKDQVKAAFQFCQNHVGDSFNKYGYYMQPFSKGSASTEGKNTWFCSEIVAGALEPRERTFPCHCTAQAVHGGERHDDTRLPSEQRLHVVLKQPHVKKAV